MTCLDELGPVSPRAYPPAPGWSLDGHRIKAPLEYSRGPEKVWVYGALRVEDGQALTLTGPSRNTKGYLRLLQAVEEANPAGEIYLITDNLASHKSPPIQEWLAVNFVRAPLRQLGPLLRRSETRRPKRSQRFSQARIPSPGVSTSRSHGLPSANSHTSSTLS